MEPIDEISCFNNEQMQVLFSFDVEALTSRFVLNTAKSFGRLLLFFKVHQAGNHDPLGLWRSRAVHGFGQISDRGRPQTEIFDQPENPEPVFRGNIGPGLEVFIHPLGGFRRPQIFFGGHRHHETSGDILSQS